VIKVDFDVHPGFHPDLPASDHHAERKFNEAMLRQ
jgi:hypothetical protein